MNLNLIPAFVVLCFLLLASHCNICGQNGQGSCIDQGCETHYDGICVEDKYYKMCLCYLKTKGQPKKTNDKLLDYE